jgi:AAA domain
VSNTRRASEGSTLRQERFASSQEFERGLMANLVAKRCTVLERAEDLDLIWFIQLLSHQSAGIKHLAAELMARFPDRIASASMRKFGAKPGQIYSADQVKIARDQMPYGCLKFPLADEIDFENKGRIFPATYRAADFAKCCHDAAAAGLERHLLELCLDPALPVGDGSPWYFPALISTLRDFQAEWIAERRPAVVTSVGEKVVAALDYAMQSRRLVLIDGLPRIGKSHSAKAWCDLYPGKVRYVECPATNDDFSFFRAIAQSLGVSINLKSKAQELRNRVEETLQGGDLAMVIDEAHYLWPQSHYRNTNPVRINWLMTALVNHGVAISLITTPQFFRSQKAIEQATCWTSAQFTGRIGHYETLPAELTLEDLENVAAALLPDASAVTVELLVHYARASAKYLAGIRHVVDRAGFIARKEGREKIQFADVKCALKEAVIPSDTAFAAAVADTNNPARKRAARVVATSLQPAFAAPAIPLPVERSSRRSVRPARVDAHKARGENFAELVSAVSTSNT